MAAVAREAGVSSALLHYYFATREDLIRHAFELQDRRAVMLARERAGEIPDPRERVVEALRHELSDDPAVRESWIMWSEMQRLAMFHEDMRASVVDRSARWIGEVADLIAAAQAGGRIDPEIDASTAALRLTALTDGLGGHVIIESVPRAEALRLLDVAIAEVLG
jgi:AcrR family transcriptional regulator